MRSPEFLRYDLLYVSTAEGGKDNETISRELKDTDKATGWISGKECTYPQTLIFRIKDSARLCRIDLLFHSVFLPQWCKVSVAESENFGGYEDPLCLDYEFLVKMEFLDPTSTDGHRRIYLDTEFAEYVKLEFHEPHSHQQNLHKQVGLIEVKLRGFLNEEGRVEYKTFHQHRHNHSATERRRRIAERRKAVSRWKPDDYSDISKPSRDDSKASLEEEGEVEDGSEFLDALDALINAKPGSFPNVKKLDEVKAVDPTLKIQVVDKWVETLEEGREKQRQRRIQRLENLEGNETEKPKKDVIKPKYNWKNYIPEQPARPDPKLDEASKYLDELDLLL